jgi:hypothetical protein
VIFFTANGFYIYSITSLQLRSRFFPRFARRSCGVAVSKPTVARFPQCAWFIP